MEVAYFPHFKSLSKIPEFDLNKRNILIIKIQELEVFFMGLEAVNISFIILFRPGSIQGRGENLIRLVKAFSNSSLLLNEAKNTHRSDKSLGTDERAVFFDYLTFFMASHFLPLRS